MGNRWSFDDLYTKVKSKMYEGSNKLHYKSIGFISEVLSNGYTVQVFSSREELHPFSAVRMLDDEGLRAVEQESTEVSSILDSVLKDLESNECTIQKYFKRTTGLMVKLAFLRRDISMYTHGDEVRVVDLMLSAEDFSSKPVKKVRHLHKLDKGTRAELETFLRTSMEFEFSSDLSVQKHDVRDCYATHLRWKKADPGNPSSKSFMFISFNARMSAESATEYLEKGIHWHGRFYQVERPMTKTAKFVARNPLMTITQPPSSKKSPKDSIPAPLGLRKVVSGGSICSSITIEPPPAIESPPMSPAEPLKLKSWASINSAAGDRENFEFPTMATKSDDYRSPPKDESTSLAVGSEKARTSSLPPPPRPLKMRNWASYNESDTLCPNELPAMPCLKYPQLPPAIVLDHTSRPAMRLSRDNSQVSLGSVKEESNEESAVKEK